MSVIKRVYANLDYPGHDFIGKVRDYLSEPNSASLGPAWAHDIAEYTLIYSGEEIDFVQFSHVSDYIKRHSDTTRHRLHFKSKTGRFIKIDAGLPSRIELQAFNDDRSEQFVGRIEELLGLVKLGDNIPFSEYQRMRYEQDLLNCGWQRNWITWGTARSAVGRHVIPKVSYAADERYYFTFDIDMNHVSRSRFCPSEKGSFGDWIDFTGGTQTESLRKWGARVIELIQYGGGAIDGPQVWFLEAGKPRSAHLELAAIFRELSGELRICDPYYGSGSLARLDLLLHCGPIQFLTRTADAQEAATLPRLLTEYQRQNQKCEFRRNADNALHDRFILSDKELIFLGHGLKDAGNKESLIIRLPREVVGDTADALAESFNQKWAAATVLP